MNALILGGTGFIGTRVAHKLATLSINVRVYSPSAISGAITDRITGVSGRMEDTEALISQSNWADIIFHFVSTTNPKTSSDNHEYDLSSNLIPLIHLLDFLRLNPTKRLVFCSSGGSVYGNVSNVPISENCEKTPLNSYGLVKSLMEDYIQFYYRKYNISHLILRPSNVYGPKLKSIGDQGIISTLMYNALLERSTTWWASLNTIRDYLYIDDFAEAVAELIMHNAEGVYNLGSGQGFTLTQIIDAVQVCTGKILKFEYAKNIINHSSVNILDISKITQATGWAPKTTLIEGINLIYSEMMLDIKKTTV